MTESQDTVCFTCGQPSGETPRLNCLPGGQVCPTCRDRLLESLPPCLPGEGGSLEEYYEEAESSPGCTEDFEDAEVDEEHDSAQAVVQLQASKGPGQYLTGDNLEDEPA